MSDGSHQTDQQLIAAINEGCSDSFAVLYHRYKDWVVQLAWRFTGSHDDALDVLQETFAYLVRKFPGFELTAAMTTFLYPAVRNLSIAARKKRQRSTSPEAVTDQLQSIMAPADQVESELTGVLSGLSESHREILLMRFVDELTQPEIATALNLPVGTVKSRLHHAVQAVKNCPEVLNYLQQCVQ